MEFDYQWFWRNFAPTLKKFTVVEKSFLGSQFGDSQQVEFEIQGKIVGYVTMYSTGVLDMVVLDENHDTLLNNLIVHQNENTNKEKEKAFDELKGILSKFIDED